MSPSLPLKFCILPAAMLFMASCSTMSGIKSSTTAGLGKMGQGIGKMGSGVGKGFTKMGEGVGKGFDKVADATTAPFKPGIPIVEAREEELEERPLGHEQALAYQKRQRRGFWFFGGPVDFEEPTLPADAGGMEGGLLPPKLD